MKNKLLILGSGGHGKVVADVAEKSNLFQEISFLDNNFLNYKGPKLVNSKKVIGEISEQNIQSDYTLAEASISKEKISNKKSSTKGSELVKYKSQSNFTFGKFLSLIVVFIISFIALIIVLDTFKGPLYNYIPNLEIWLFNLFEILKDIKLFIEDLF